MPLCSAGREQFTHPGGTWCIEYRIDAPFAANADSNLPMRLFTLSIRASAHFKNGRKVVSAAVYTTGDRKSLPAPSKNVYYTAAQRILPIVVRKCVCWFAKYEFAGRKCGVVQARLFSSSWDGQRKIVIHLRLSKVYLVILEGGPFIAVFNRKSSVELTSNWQIVANGVIK